MICGWEWVKLCCGAEEGVSLRKVTIVEDRLRLISLIEYSVTLLRKYLRILYLTLVSNNNKTRRYLIPRVK